MEANKSVAKEKVMADNQSNMLARPTTDHAALDAVLTATISQFGYAKTLRQIELAWKRRNCTWPAYQQLKNVARNINARIQRSVAQEQL